MSNFRELFSRIRNLQVQQTPYPLGQLPELVPPLVEHSSPDERINVANLKVSAKLIKAEIFLTCVASPVLGIGAVADLVGESDDLKHGDCRGENLNFVFTSLMKSRVLTEFPVPLPFPRRRFSSLSPPGLCRDPEGRQRQRGRRQQKDQPRRRVHL